jgi:hypothetical protein
MRAFFHVTLFFCLNSMNISLFVMVTCVFIEVRTEFSFRNASCHDNVRPTSILLARLLSMCGSAYA